MRKQTKLVAVLSAAALLAIGASMTSFAASGWQEENGTWVYYKKDGEKATTQWAKSGNNWFYLNIDGEMVTDELIDEDGTNYYYVDSNGAMVTNAWVAIDNENAGDEDEPDAYWYYFQSNGKAYKSSDKISWKTINGKSYAFDSEGRMLYGWVKSDATRATGDDAWRDGNFYCGDENDGARTSGWSKLHVLDSEEDKDYWFYFNPANGKKTVPSVGNDYIIRSINGKKYAFNTDGVMQDGWADTATPSANEASISNYQYFNGADQGWRLQKGWVKVVPQEKVNSSAYEDDSTKWFYGDGSGNLAKSELKLINGKKYAFNEKGEMISGLWALNVSSTGTINGEMIEINDASKFDTALAAYKKSGNSYAVYYFGGGDDGAAKTGNQTIDVDGENYSYVFGTSGTNKYKGTNAGANKKDKTLLVLGRKIKADRDYKCEAFDLDGVKVTLTASSELQTTNAYLVDSNGSILRNKTNLKDADGMYYCTDKDTGKVTYYNGEQYKKK